MAHTIIKTVLMIALSMATAGLGLANPLISDSGDDGVSEAEVKAAFLFNFTKFVEWPADSFENQASPIVIGVVDRGSFLAALAQTVKGKAVNGRGISVKRVESTADLQGCHVLFFTSAAKHRVAELLPLLGTSSVLTVGEFDSFAASGGMINFFLHDGRVRFEINPHATLRTGLHLSSKLLSLARLLQPGGERK